METVMLTHELIEAGASVNHYNKKQLAILGVAFPLRSGWKNRLLGRTIPRAVYDQFIAASTRAKREKKLAQQPELLKL